MKRRRAAYMAFIVVVVLGTAAWGHAAGAVVEADDTPIAAEFTGQWVLVAARSTPVDPWSDLQLDLAVNGAEITIRRIWTAGSRNRHVDSLTVPTDGTPVDDPIYHWADSRHLGVYVGPDSARTATARTLDKGRTLQVETEQTLHTSQGSAPIRVYSEYRISPDGNELALLELRSSRHRPIHFLFRRAEDSNP